MRSPGRDEIGLRPITLEPNFIKYPEGSCLIRMGETWVICNASIEEKVPPFLERKGQGWVTAEYRMLPRSTHSRMRTHANNIPNGRAQEIQRLVGRALRSCIDLSALGERSITIDCDVIQADGGTRTAAINGGFVALAQAVMLLQKKKVIATSPIRGGVAAISIGLKNNEPLVDLDYNEDSSCDIDMNFVMLDGGKIVEMQGTAEKGSFSAAQSAQMLTQAQLAIDRILLRQREILRTLS